MTDPTAGVDAVVVRWVRRWWWAVLLTPALLLALGVVLARC